MTALEVIGWYVLGAGFVSVLVLTVAIHFYGKVPPLLDGTPLQSVLDDNDRRHMVDRCVAAEQREVRAVDELAVALEEIRALPTIEPWRRWMP